MAPDSSDQLNDTIRFVHEVQALPYVWPSPPDAESARKRGVGSCASKHALLAAELEAIGVRSRPVFVVGPLVPKLLATDPEIAPGAHLSEVHECLTVLTPWAGPLEKALA